MRLLEYKQSSRSYAPYYLLLLGCLPFIYLSLTFDGEGFPTPVWPFRIISGLAGIFFLGILFALLRRSEWGSYVDLTTQQLVWWETHPETKEGRIALSQLGKISIGEENFFMYSLHGEQIYFPVLCAPTPWTDWAHELHKHFPHIVLEKKW